MADVEEPMDVDSSFLEDTGVDEVDDTNLESFKDQESASTIESSHILEPRYENKGGTFTTGIDIFSKEEQQKMEERAKRFGLKKQTKQSIVDQEEDLYTSMGVVEDNENVKHIRLNVLHMRGTEEMSTQDVFEYFKEYPPASIEWINDVSCNVVWLDKITTARALLGLSKKIVGLGTKIATESHIKSEENSLDDENKPSHDDHHMTEVVVEDNSAEDKSQDCDNTISLKAIDFPLPPGVWRKGNDCPKSKTILLRFATSSDKKQQNSEKLSEYYKKYGNPNFGGMKGILTDKRKRVYKEIRSTKKRHISESDENDDRKRLKNPWGSLSETWGTHDSVEDDFIRRTYPKDEVVLAMEKGSIKERLGFKPQQKERAVVVAAAAAEDSNSESSSDDEEEWSKRSKTLRMRMHADDEEEKVQKKKLKQLTQKMQETISSNDLRSRLGRSRPPPVYRDAIQVIVTNEPERYKGSMRLEEEDVEEVEEASEEVFHAEEEEDEEEVVEEREEGEWVEDDEHVEQTTVEEPEEGEADTDSDSSSDISEKEIQGPKGSVIKVVPRAKPRVASTVWARLNHNEEKNHSLTPDRRDLRGSLKGDLRSRLGYHNRERSPLRIEVKNDKYAEESNESE